MTQHRLDPWPEPREKKPLFINEPWVIDGSLADQMITIEEKDRAPDPEEDNIRVYLPLDLNQKAILRRLKSLIIRYGEANEANELDFGCDVDRLVYQIEIYDQIWYVRHTPPEGEHSREGVALVREFVRMLEEIPDGGAEMFPFEMIDELRAEYGV